MLVQDHVLYVGCDDGIYVSKDSTTLTKIGAYPKYFPAVQHLAIDGATIYVGSDEWGSRRGLWVSKDLGNNWKCYYLNSTGRKVSPIDGIYVYDKTVFVLGRDENGNKTVFIEQNDLDHWSKTNLSVNAICGDGSYIYLACDDGLYVSTTKGQNWTLLTYVKAIKIAARDNDIYLLQTDGLYLSHDKGKTWLHKNYLLNIHNTANSISKSLFAATNDGLYIAEATGTVRPPMFPGQEVTMVKTNQNKNFGETIYAAIGSEFFASNDDGKSFELLKKFRNLQNNYISTFYASDKLIIIGTQNALYVSSNGGKSWNKEPSAPIISIFGVGKTVYAGTTTGLMATFDEGSTWKSLDFGKGEASVSAIYAENDTIYIDVPFSGILVSRDLGVHWSALANTEKWGIVTAITKSADQKTLLVVHDGKVQSTQDVGASWKTLTPSTFSVDSLMISENDYYVGTEYSGLYTSNDQGKNWKRTL